MLESIFCAVLGTSFSVTLFLVPILLLSPLLQKYFQPKVSCFLWAIVAVRLLLPTIPGEQPQISIPVPSYQISLVTLYKRRSGYIISMTAKLGIK